MLNSSWSLDDGDVDAAAAGKISERQPIAVVFEPEGATAR